MAPYQRARGEANATGRAKPTYGRRVELWRIVSMQVPHLHTMITTPREVQKNRRFRIAFVLKQVHLVDAREVVVEADDIPLATMHMAHTCRVYVETDKMPGGGDLGSVRVRWNAVCLGPKALIAKPWIRRSAAAAVAG